jgi:hypothetical protein
MQPRHFQSCIVPRLEMNRNNVEDQRHALTRVDHAIRGQLLGRTLHAVRYNPDFLFRFLSENVPAFVRSDKLVRRAVYVVTTPTYCLDLTRMMPHCFRTLGRGTSYCSYSFYWVTGKGAALMLRLILHAFQR